MSIELRFANNASSRLHTAIDAVSTSIRVQDGDGVKFPATDATHGFMVTLEDRRSGQIEICLCTARSTDFLTVERAQEGTIAQAFAVGATVSNRLTAASMNAIMAGGAPTWDEVLEKPATFPPTLPIPQSGVTDLTARLTAIEAEAVIDADNLAQEITDRGTADSVLNTIKEDKASKGIPGGYASLDGSAKVPASQLPAFVDDVLEFPNLASFPDPGSTGVIYVALDTNKVYRWSGSTYTEISPSPGSTDAVPEGSVNLYYTNARASAAAPVQSVNGRVGAITLTKADVGLSNVDNTSDINKPVSTAQAAADATKVNKAGDTMTGALTVPASSATVAGLNIGNGTAPTSPANGDIWITTGGGLQWRAASGTYSALNTTGAQTISGVKTYTAAPIFPAAVAGAASFRVNPGVDPTAPVNGDVWTTATGMFARINGVTMQLDGGNAAIGVGPPANPTNGQLWWNNETGRLFIYYNDGNSQQWVEIPGPNVDTSAFAVETWGDLLPDLSFSGNKPGLTYSDRWGRWRKVGKTCTYWWEFTLSALGTGNGTAVIPLPFTAVAGGLIAGTVGYTNSIVAGYANMGCYISADRTRLVLSRPSSTTNETGMTAAGEGTFTNTSRVAGSITYEVA